MRKSLRRKCDDIFRGDRCLRKAVELLPDDQQAWMGLGQVLFAQQKLEDADKAFSRTIEINPATQIAEAARRASSGLAQKAFRGAGMAGLRMDALMYCVAALEKFEKMAPGEVRKVGFEIAALGTRGINPNDTGTRYELRSMPGSFSGLELLCYMFAAFQKIDPNASIGFDVKPEYEAAVGIRSKKEKE